MLDSKINVKIGLIIDVFVKDNIFVVIKDEFGVKKEYISYFKPYFYISTSRILSETDIEIISKNLKGLFQIIHTHKENKEFLYKLIFLDVASLVSSRDYIKKNILLENNNIEMYEFDIPFLQRFFIDKKIYNFRKVKFSSEGNVLLNIEPLDTGDLKINYTSLTFDIEVLCSKKVFPTPDKNKIISIACANEKNKKVVFFLVEDLNLEKDNKLEDTDIFYFNNEILMIESFMKYVKDFNPDIVFTYNGDGFDFEYLYKRYKKLAKKEFLFGEKIINFNKRPNKSVSINGSIHFDVYKLIRLLNYLQVFNYSKFDLNSIYPKLTGNKKLVLDPDEMRYAYSNKDYLKIIKYNLDDVIATKTLGYNYSNIIFELSKILNFPLFNVLRSTSSPLVERMFIKYFKENNLIIPNKPSILEIQERYKHSFSGAFVQPPKYGLQKNIAVLDFRSYHISLIISYNISPETIDVKNCDSELNSFKILDHYICKNKKGIVPKLLENLLNLRLSIKKEMQLLEKEDLRYKTLYAQQYALKILLASTYGYMGFAGARWYCKECLEIMYYLVRTKIKETISLFVNKGYDIIYGDTDSCFLHFENLEKLKKDLKEVNDSLPTVMSLELQDIYKTGIFVFSRGSEKIAKKKYALLDNNNHIKIKGFESVRRDWCELVKETQRKVLEIVLKEENPKKAINLVKQVILNLQEHKVKKEKLVIRSFVHKKLNNYKSVNPAMFALLEAKKKGKVINRNSLVEFIITNISSKTISEKARLAEFVKENDYDVNYYINNQLIPSVYPILEVFNISKNELLTGKKQTGLNDFNYS